MTSAARTAKQQKIYEDWKIKVEGTTMTEEEWLKASETLVRKLEESNDDRHHL